MKPERIQRRRVKGWKLPPNTVCVTRGPGARFHNPFIISRGGYANGRWYIDGPWLPYSLIAGNEEGARMIAVDLFRSKVAPSLPVHELRGKNLACWCPLDQACHADVLLELANR